jgi:uncharacterized RDD family membrane protein YckC
MAGEQAHPEPLSGEYAGFVTRLAAFIIDRLIVFAAVSFITAISAFLLDFFNIPDLLGTPEESRLIIGGSAGILGLLAYVAYDVVFRVLAGQTPAMRFLGLRVVRTDGSRLGWVRALIREFGYLISAIFFFLGFLWILVDNRRQGWHDKLAGTLVVYASPAPVAIPAKKHLPPFQGSQDTIQ